MATNGASINPIFERLNSAPQHHPLNADTFSDWSMEAGDTVTVTRDGQEYSTPIHSSTMTWKGGAPMVRVNSTGNEKREAVAKMSKRKYSGGGGGMRNDKGLHADLIVTESRIYGYVEDTYNQMRSGLELTSSSAALYVDSAYNQMKSGLELTSSSAALYVTDSYNKLSAGIRVSTSAACMYARSADNAAEIVAQINKSTGQSEIKLNANRVYIGNSSTTTVVSGKLDASEFTAANISAKIQEVTSLRIQNATVTGELYVGGGGGSTSIRNAYNGVTKTEENGSITLTFSKFNGTSYASDSVTFSRAVASFDMRWSSGTLYVTARPQGDNCGTTIVGGTASWEGRTVTIPIKAYNSTRPSSQVDTGREVTATFTASKSDISASRGGRSSSAPSADASLTSIVDNGYYVISVTACGVTKTYRIQVAVPTTPTPVI